MWWREPGFFSGPLLANSDFRRRFLERLREICTNVFTEGKIFPLIEGMETRLAAEIPIRASLSMKSPQAGEAEFRANIQSLRNQVTHRRKYLIAELEKLGISRNEKIPLKTGRVNRR